MLIEVSVLQRFVLLLGHPVYSLTVTLFSLLLGTGLGARLEPAVRQRGLALRRRCAVVAGDRRRWLSASSSVVHADRALGDPVLAPRPHC